MREEPLSPQHEPGGGASLYGIARTANTVRRGHVRRRTESHVHCA